MSYHPSLVHAPEIFWPLLLSSEIVCWPGVSSPFRFKGTHVYDTCYDVQLTVWDVCMNCDMLGDVRLCWSFGVWHLGPHRTLQMFSLGWPVIIRIMEIPDIGTRHCNNLWGHIMHDGTWTQHMQNLHEIFNKHCKRKWCYCCKSYWPCNIETVNECVMKN